MATVGYGCLERFSVILFMYFGYISIVNGYLQGKKEKTSNLLQYMSKLHFLISRGRTIKTECHFHEK